jgi:hypothetical protein
MLFLEISEAAPIIGKCSKRAWQYWESGRSIPPEKVYKSLEMSLKFRNNLFNKAKKEVLKSSNKTNLRWYRLFEEFRVEYHDQNELAWRIYQSILVGLKAEIPEGVELSREGRVLDSIDYVMKTVKSKR